MKRNRVYKNALLASLLGYFSDLLFSEKYSKEKGLLQKFSPAAKLISLLLIIVAISFSKNLPLLVCFFIATIFLALMSKIDFFYFLKRSFTFIPLFSLIIALPAVFNFITPGENLFVITRHPYEISITKEGLLLGLIFVMRVTASVSFVILIKLTTGFDHLLQALNKILPRSFGFAIGMSYRFLKIMALLLENMNLARISRGFNYNAQFSKKNFAASGFFLFKRSLFMAEDISNSMLARGFDGDIKFFNIRKFDFRDFLLIIPSVSVLTAVLLV